MVLLENLLEALPLFLLLLYICLVFLGCFFASISITDLVAILAALICIAILVIRDMQTVTGTVQDK